MNCYVFCVLDLFINGQSGSKKEAFSSQILNGSGADENWCDTSVPNVDLGDAMAESWSSTMGHEISIRFHKVCRSNKSNLDCTQD